MTGADNGKNPVIDGPLTREETRVYLPKVAGGFDVRDCPDPEWLAEQIVKRWNAYPELVKALRHTLMFAPAGDCPSMRARHRALLRELGEPDDE